MNDKALKMDIALIDYTHSVLSALISDETCKPLIAPRLWT